MVFEAELCLLRRLRDQLCLYLCRQGPELGNQIKEGDPGRRAEGQHGLWGRHQGEAAVILCSAANCVKTTKLIKTTNFVLQDYESDLAAYTSGLETLLNIPIKRTMLKSPTVDLNQEVTDQKRGQTLFAWEVLTFCVTLSQAAQLQTRYMELLTMSADYYRFLGDLLKNMEELKVQLRCSTKKKTSLRCD